MSLASLAMRPMLILLVSVSLLHTDSVCAQVQFAYRHNWIQRFIVTNNILVGSEVNRSFAFGYELHSTESSVDLSELCGPAEAPECQILTPREGDGWWAETPYAVSSIDAYLETRSDDCSNSEFRHVPVSCFQPDDLVATRHRTDRFEFSGIFYIDGVAQFPWRVDYSSPSGNVSR